jgi:hypothetical protein
MSEEKEATFKVIDRRPFNSDGTPRSDFQEGEKSQPAAAQAPGQPAAETVVGPTAGPRAAAPIETSPLFADFVMGLVSSAAMSLGMVEHPAAGQKVVDLPTAKQMIDLLGVLREKTRGNLSHEEEQIFEGSLTELRMRYVQLAGKTRGA